MKSTVSTKDNIRRIARNTNELPRNEIETSFHSSIYTLKVCTIVRVLYDRGREKIWMWSFETVERQSNHFSRRTIPTAELITLLFPLSSAAAARIVNSSTRRNILAIYKKNVNRACNLLSSTILFVITFANAYRSWTKQRKDDANHRKFMLLVYTYIHTVGSLLLSCCYCHIRHTCMYIAAGRSWKTILYPPRSYPLPFTQEIPKKYNPAVSDAHALETLPAIIHARRMLLPQYGRGAHVWRYVSQVSGSFFLRVNGHVCSPSNRLVSTYTRIYAQVWYNSR